VTGELVDRPIVVKPGWLRACPVCDRAIPDGHHGAFGRRKGPRRRAWKVASWCDYCEVYWIVRISHPVLLACARGSDPIRPATASERGASPGAHGLYQSPVHRARGPEIAIARRAVFRERGRREPVAQ